MKRKRDEQKPNSSSSSSSIIPRNESSAEIVASIDDLLRKILLKLPIKSLIQSQLVCKPWLSLISNPKFFHNPNPVRGILFGYISKFQYIPLYPNMNPIPLESPPTNLHLSDGNPFNTSILDSCNGLILYPWGPRIYICNPTTNCSISLPQDPTISSLSTKGTNIVFDPDKSQHYKVVTVLFNWRVKGGMYSVRIYSSETGAWSSVGEIPTVRCGQFQFPYGVYWNGSIHWLSLGKSRKGLRFHVDTLVFNEMPSPPRTLTSYEESWFYFGQSCDHLHFAECILPRFNIYELASDYSEWFIKYQVDLSNLISDYPEVKRTFLPGTYVTYIMSLVREKKDGCDSSFIVLRTPGKAIKCSLVDGSLEELCDFNEHIRDDYVSWHDEFKCTMGFSDTDVVEYIPCFTNI